MFGEMIYFEFGDYFLGRCNHARIPHTKELSEFLITPYGILKNTECKRSFPFTGYYDCKENSISNLGEGDNPLVMYSAICCSTNLGVKGIKVEWVS